MLGKLKAVPLTPSDPRKWQADIKQAMMGQQIIYNADQEDKGIDQEQLDEIMKSLCEVSLNNPHASTEEKTTLNAITRICNMGSEGLKVKGWKSIHSFVTAVTTFLLNKQRQLEDNKEFQSVLVKRSDSREDNGTKRIPNPGAKNQS